MGFHSPWRRQVCFFFALVAAVGVRADGAVGDPYAVVRGMTISCPDAGQVWGSDRMVDAMREVKSLGVNWITIHPYAGIRGDGTVGGTGGLSRMYADPIWLTRPIAEAHALGLKIMIKPHIAYWGSPFAWRGAIRFETEEQWRRFFDSYERWLTTVAELSRDADAFVVGTELDGTVSHAGRWREIIAAVRVRTNAPLTYCAGWDRYESVPFWDALDVIGIQAYFPLADHDRLPAPEELDRAWDRWMARLASFAGREHRKIVFGELGYNLSAAAAVRPWDYHQGGVDAAEVQRRCLTAALRAIQRSPVVVGAFLWKWFPGPGSHHENFLASTPSMRAVIARYWGSPAAAPASGVAR